MNSPSNCIPLMGIDPTTVFAGLCSKHDTHIYLGTEVSGKPALLQEPGSSTVLQGNTPIDSLGISPFDSGLGNGTRSLNRLCLNSSAKFGIR